MKRLIGLTSAEIQKIILIHNIFMVDCSKSKDCSPVFLPPQNQNFNKNDRLSPHFLVS